MALSRLPSLLLWLLAMVVTSMGHICIISPRQRGPMDISGSGSHTCFRHGEPCGGQPTEAPKTFFTPGETAFITWQQNLNHYEPGYPGYMDISIAFGVNETDFTTLAVVTDSYVHAQNHQQNYTAIVKIPMHICNHCVLRARYNAHKPGESTFIQCSDVMIEPPPPGQAPKPKTLPNRPETKNIRKALHFTRKFRPRQRKTDGGILLYGFAYNPFHPGKTEYVSINTTTGQFTKLAGYDFGLDSGLPNVERTTGDRISMSKAAVSPHSKTQGSQGRYMLDEVIAVDYLRNTTVFMLHDYGNAENPATTLYTVGSKNGSLVEYSKVNSFDGNAFNALSWHTYKTYSTFSLEPSTEKPGAFNLVVGLIDGDNAFTKIAQSDEPEGLYVNFQWMERDLNNRNVYVLLGNENSLSELQARIYTFDLWNEKYIGQAEVDVSNFTFSAMHSLPNSDTLYAFSPGLYDDPEATWSLVAVNPMTGAVSYKCPIAPAGVFERYYGGSVHAGSYNEAGTLYHVLRVANTDSDVIVSVDPNTCQHSFSELTNLRHIHNINRLCALDNENNCFIK